jgi:hypothetical protein
MHIRYHRAACTERLHPGLYRAGAELHQSRKFKIGGAVNDALDHGSDRRVKCVALLGQVLPNNSE